MQKLQAEFSTKTNHELTFPMASSPLSKKKMTPRNENKTPNAVSPSPISVSFKISVEICRMQKYWLRKKLDNNEHILSQIFSSKFEIIKFK